MLTTTMKYVAIWALLVSMFWQVSPNLRSYLDFVVAVGAVFILVQAVNLHKYWWTAIFAVVLCLFNPIRPVSFSFGTLMSLQIMTAAVFAVSLQMLRTKPRLSIASITEANPKSESL